MNYETAVREALAGLPVQLKNPASIEKLDGGLHNEVYRVSADDSDFVLRLGPKQPGLPDLSCELSILGSAAEAGIGPDVEFADAERGILLLRFLPGRTWERQDLLVAANLETLSGLLRSVHNLPVCGTELDIAGLAENNLRDLYERDELRDFGSVCYGVVERRPAMASATCCHNDVVAANLIAGDALRLIDWEWAADNDPMFDLASVIAYHDLESRQVDALLSAYAGNDDSSLREQLREQLRLFDALQWLWLAAREANHPDTAQAARLWALRSRIET